jgi:predicted nucleic acid-binding protein
VSPHRAAEAIADLADFDLHRHSHVDLLTRAWKPREKMTTYDAVYIALGEALEAPTSHAMRRSPRRPVTGRASK